MIAEVSVGREVIHHDGRSAASTETDEYSFYAQLHRVEILLGDPKDGVVVKVTKLIKDTDDHSNRIEALEKRLNEMWIGTMLVILGVVVWSAFYTALIVAILWAAP